MTASVTLAVLTFRRPGDLAEILPLLLEQARSVDGDVWSVSVLVVDNDPAAGASENVLAVRSASAAGGSEGQLRYEHEPVPGISAARNRALEASLGNDLLIFIDDDERPSERWLAHLLEAWTTFGSTAVVGPVVSSFDVEPSAWVASGNFFTRRSFATGTYVDVAATNNLLIDLDFVRRTGLRFDLDFGISGGDDTMLTRQLRRLGGTIVWCAEAVVTDVVPGGRVTRRWVLQRAFSSGNSWSLVAVKLMDGRMARAAERLRLTVRGTARFTGGAVRGAAGYALRSPAHQARGLRTAARGAGMLAGAYGYSYREYRRD